MKIITYNGKMFGNLGIVSTVNKKYVKLQVFSIRASDGTGALGTLLELNSFSVYDTNGRKIPLTYEYSSPLTPYEPTSPADHLVDGDPNTYWITSPQGINNNNRAVTFQDYPTRGSADYTLANECIGAYAVFSYLETARIASYRITTGRTADRNPFTWHLYESLDDTEWELIDRRFENDTVTGTATEYSFSIGGDLENILGRNYPVTDIAGKRWMSRNLDMLLPGITDAVSTDYRSKEDLAFPWSFWYNDDRAGFGRFGRLYSGYCIGIINAALAGTGWRVATKQDLENLSEYVGGNNTLSLFSVSDTYFVSGGNYYQCSNAYGLSLKCTDMYYSSSMVFGGFPSNMIQLWTGTVSEGDSDVNWYAWIYRNNNNLTLAKTNYCDGMYIRLVRDLS